MNDDPPSKEIPEEPLSEDAELEDFLRLRPWLRGRSTRAIQIQMRRERRMAMGEKFLRRSRADK
jgi:hypothetical protein